MTSGVPSLTPGKHRGRRSAVAAVLLGTLITGSAIVAAGAASPAAAVDAPGYIALRTSATGGTVSSYSLDGTAIQVGAQTIAGNKSTCVLTTKTDPGFTQLLSFSGTATSFAGGSIGFPEKKTGVSCSQVNAPTESITLTLPAGYNATLAVLDLELKQSAQVLATVTSSAGAVGRFELRSGASIDAPAPLPGTGAASLSVCNNPADSGPDSGINDNCRWVIAGAQLNSITLQAVQGAFSLEGGVDGTVTSTSGVEPAPPAAVANSSYFYLGGLCSPSNSTVTIQGAAQAGDGSSYTRHGVNADGSTCLALPTTLTRDEAGDLELAKPLGQPFEQGLATAQWFASPDDAAENSTEVNFWADKRPSGWVPITWCPDTLMNADGSVKWITGIVPATAVTQLNALGLSDLDQRTTALGNENNLYQYACVVERSTRYIKSDDYPDFPQGTFKTIDTIYILGDIFIRR